MTHWYDTLFAERSSMKVAGLFTDRNEAQDAAIHLLRGSGMRRTQVRLLCPHEGSYSNHDLLARPVETEQGGIWQPIFRTHMAMGFVGMLAGTVLYLALLAIGSPLVHSTLLAAWVAMAGFGCTFGLLIGGLLAMRPDHGRLIAVVRKALEKGQWAVITHPVNAEQTHRAVNLLEHDRAYVVRSF